MACLSLLDFRVGDHSNIHPLNPFLLFLLWWRRGCLTASGLSVGFPPTGLSLQKLACSCRGCVSSRQVLQLPTAVDRRGTSGCLVALNCLPVFPASPECKISGSRRWTGVLVAGSCAKKEKNFPFLSCSTTLLPDIKPTLKINWRSDPAWVTSPAPLLCCHWSASCLLLHHLLL